MSLRTRMTLLYGGLFALMSAALLIVVERLQRNVFNRVGDVPAISGQGDGTTRTATIGPEELRQSLLRKQQEIADQQHQLTLVAIAVVTVLAFVVCWWLTGRLLRPLQRINGTARRLSISNLHERIGLTGRRDELTELADTFDAMLDRLETAVASQRRFVANASHELRTPLAIQRTAIEVGLDDPSPERLARIRAEMLRTTERSERLIDGLLTLAQGEHGPRDPAPVALTAIVEQVVEQVVEQIGEQISEQAGEQTDEQISEQTGEQIIEQAGEQATADHRPGTGTPTIDLTVEAPSQTVQGDEVLLTRLVANLVENAVRYNRPGGEVTIRVAAGTLTVGNTGPEVPPGRVAELFEPFRRLHPDRTGAADGAGLGLSIVAAIAHAHGAAVHATANPRGGLTVTVNFHTEP